MTAHEVSMTLAGQWPRHARDEKAQRDRLRQAAQLGRQHPDWMIWLGKASGCFDAMHPRVPEIIQAGTAAELVDKIRSWELDGRITPRRENVPER
jgi:hypothetical protein